MNRHTMFATVLCLCAAVVSADIKPMPADPAQRQGGLTPTKPPATIQVQISGKITWIGNVKLDPGNGDACSRFKVKVFYPKDATNFPDEYVGISTKGLGNIKQGRCSFVIGKGVPEGKALVLVASYEGIKGSGSGQTSMFIFDGKESQDIEVALRKL